jgi:hypothetical protein
VTEENKGAMGLGREKASRHEPEAVDDTTILDYIMLDFGDEPFAPRHNEQRGRMTEPWRHE